MSLSHVLEKLDKIADTTSTNDKVILLREYLKDNEFLKVVKYTLSKDMIFHIKKLPKYKPSLRKGTVQGAFNILENLSKQSGASDTDKQNLVTEASVDKDTMEVVHRICNKDLKCGVSGKLVNKARPGTVNLVPYMRCSTEKKIDNIQYPAIIQEKADGMFVNLMINKKKQIKIITRNGKTVHQLSHLKKFIREHVSDFFTCTVYTGELLVIKNDEVLDRKTGNGILNSCIHGTASEKDAACVVFRFWDCLPLSNFYNGYDEQTFLNRRAKCKKFVKDIRNTTLIDMVFDTKVENYNQAKEFYKKIRDAGGEGAILKNIYAEWKDHTSPNMIKMKNVSEAELEVISWGKGKPESKYAHCMGAITARTRCGMLEVSVGSGFSDEEREKEASYWVGQIITVEFESIIKDKKKKKWSLFLPRFVERRVDRNEADSLEEIRKR